jgi:hypothetical protein
MSAIEIKEQVHELTTSTEEQNIQEEYSENISNVHTESEAIQLSHEEEESIQPSYYPSDANVIVLSPRTQSHKAIENDDATPSSSSSLQKEKKKKEKEKEEQSPSALLPSFEEEEMENFNKNTIELVKNVMDGKGKRLNRQIQLVLEEARKRHQELEELRDEEVRLGGELWVEMFDPTHDSFYYYGIFTGELSWKRPESYVMKAENDNILRVVVKIQCLFRQKLARNRAWKMKFSKILQEKKTKNKEQQETWVEIYDPLTKLLYYYCPSTNETRWEAPSMYISAKEDREMTAAITIQSYSRSFAAKQLLQKRRQEVLKLQKEKNEQEKQRFHEKNRRQYMEKNEQEREFWCRRQMLEEERIQCSFVDFFFFILKKKKRNSTTITRRKKFKRSRRILAYF